MLGLRTQETKKFELFFELVQKRAKEKECIFFLDTGDGNIFENDIMEGENLQGWLVPLSRADEFQKIWSNNEEDDEWVEFFCWVEWINSQKGIDVRFVFDL